MAEVSIERVDYGYFVRPPSETVTGASRVEPCLGYLVRHPNGVLLFDTGMGADPAVDAHYQPRRRPLERALADVGGTVAEVTAVTNCHLHFDHCGGNPSLAGRPVFVQRRELEAASTTPNYTLPALIAGDHHVQLDGESEIWPGVFLFPTPGHTAGHQSLVVRRPDGAVVVAGQSHDFASDFAADVLARRATRQGHPGQIPASPVWLRRLEDLDPRMVYFAHDHSVWLP